MHPNGQAVAIAGYNWVALLPITPCTSTPHQESPTVALLPCLLSTTTQRLKQHPPAPPPPSKNSADATMTSPQSPSKTYTSDEAWLTAQTDSKRLDAMWMSSDSSIPDLMQDQHEQLSTTMPPSGLIRSICFVGNQQLPKHCCQPQSLPCAPSAHSHWALSLHCHRAFIRQSCMVIALQLHYGDFLLMYHEL